MSQVAITKYEAESFTHRLLWAAAQHHFKAAEGSSGQGSQWSAMAALLIAYLAYEAYLNFVGDRLAPDIWKNEKSFFRQPPYQGIDGKLQFVIEKLNPLTVNKGARPYQTITKLAEFRDLLAHGKPEKYEGHIEHSIDIDPEVLQSRIWSFLQASFVQRAFEDIERFISTLHAHAKQKLSHDMWFGDTPFDGAMGYALRSKKLKT